MLNRRAGLAACLLFAIVAGQAGGAAPDDGAKGGRRVAVDGFSSGALNIDRWAVIVGVSKYKHKEWDLKYADRDADALYSMLQTAAGGGFAKDHILKLTNEQATTGAVTAALRSFLKKPGKDDLVVLYLSCHGASDPDRPANLYLLTHDTDPDDISGTALPMREISNALADNLQAGRLVILADTCHSAAIGAPGRRAAGGSDAGAVNAFLKEASKSKEGTALLTSAEANEVALEDARWGGGHGVFTHFLLRGMQGEADRDPPDGVVTLGELIEFVRVGVLKETQNKQHPAVGTSTFDRRLPMAIIGGLSAQVHDKVGRQLYELGRYLDERRPFESAAWHLGEAQRLYRVEAAKDRQADALRTRGLALLAIDEDEKAALSLTDALERGGGQAPPDALFLLGVARARLALAPKGIPGPAVESLERFIAASPNDPKAPWARQLVAGLNTPAGGPGNRFALLIGVGEFASPAIPPLRGAVNDVRFVQGILKDRYALPGDHITSITNREATAAAMIREVQKLKASMGPKDEALIYFSGHGTTDAKDRYSLVASDYGPDKAGSVGLFDAHQLVSEINGFPGRVTLIIDAMPPRDGTAGGGILGIKPPHSLILAAGPGRMVSELNTSPSEPHGAFTFHFWSEVTTNAVDRSASGVLTRVRQRMAKERAGNEQTPVAYGDVEGSFLFRPGIHTRQTESFALTLRPRRLRSVDELADFRDEILKQAGATPLPDLHGAFGLAFLERGQAQAAAHELAAEATRAKGDMPLDLAVALAIARLRSGLYDEAARDVEKLAPRLSASSKPDAEAASARARSLSGKAVNALLVGIDTYDSPDIQDLRGAVNDVESMRQALTEKFGAGKVNLTILTNEKATRNQILDAFKKLVGRSSEAPALFFFAGYGSTDESGKPTLVGANSRLMGRGGLISNDISIARDLNASVPTPTNLVTILDVGWSDDGMGPAGRFLAPPLLESREVVVDRDGLEAEEVVALKPPARRVVVREFSREGVPTPSPASAPVIIGRATLYADPARRDRGRGRQHIADEGSQAFLEIRSDRGGGAASSRRYDGRLTLALTQALKGADLESLTYARWAEAAKYRGGGTVQVAGENHDERILTNATDVGEISDILTEAEAGRFKSLVELLVPLIERRPDLAAELYLDLGIAEGVTGDYDDAIAHLDQALKRAAPEQKALVLDVRYHLGRILFESRKDLNRAVSELDLVARADPRNPRVRYYRGLAIRTIIEENLLEKAAGDLRVYLDEGTPLGRRDELQQYLKTPAVHAAPR